MKRTLSYTSLSAIAIIATGFTASTQPSWAASVGGANSESRSSASIAQTTPSPRPSDATSPSVPSSQTVNPLNRAKNLARQAGERANGGLMNYRAEASMHGNSVDSPFVDNGNGSWTFTFVGGPPGYTTPTVETVVTVFANDWRVVVDYNGPIRDRAPQTPSTP